MGLFKKQPNQFLSISTNSTRNSKFISQVSVEVGDITTKITSYMLRMHSWDGKPDILLGLIQEIRGKNIYGSCIFSFAYLWIHRCTLLGPLHTLWRHEDLCFFHPCRIFWALQRPLASAHSLCVFQNGSLCWKILLLIFFLHKIKFRV